MKKEQGDGGCVESLGRYFESSEAKSWEGFYDIDVSQQNARTFKRFQLALKRSQQGFDVFFMEAENFGLRKAWSQGDVYASSTEMFKQEIDIEITLFEARGSGEKVPVSYLFHWKSDGFTISSIGTKRVYRDHFRRIVQLNLLGDIAFSAIDFKKLNEDALQELDVEYQSGLGLMYFLSKMEDNNPSSEAVLQALDLAFALLKDAELPIAEYTSLWQAVFALSVVFAELVRHQHSWHWAFVDDSLFVKPGWVLVSPDNRFALHAGEYLYDKMMRNEDISVSGFYKKVLSVVNDKKIEAGRIYFVE